jgi:hypothetical protein
VVSLQDYPCAQQGKDAALGHGEVHVVLLVAGDVSGGPQCLPAGLPLLFQYREPLHQEIGERW